MHVTDWGQAVIVLALVATVVRGRGRDPAGPAPLVAWWALVPCILAAAVALAWGWADIGRLDSWAWAFGEPETDEASPPPGTPGKA